MCYTKIVTKKNKKYKRYNIYKEDTKMAVVKLTTDNFEQEVIQAHAGSHKVFPVVEYGLHALRMVVGTVTRFVVGLHVAGLGHLSAG